MKKPITYPVTFLIPLGLTFIIITWGLIVQKKILVVKKINCSVAQTQPCPESIAASLNQKLLHQSIFSPLIDKLDSFLNSEVKGYAPKTVQLGLGGDLIIDLVPKSPILSLQDPVKSTWILIADDGTFVSEASQSGIGTVAVSYSPTYQENRDLPISVLVNHLAELVRSLSNYGVPITQIILYQNSVITGTLPNNRLAIFSALEPISRQVASLQLILSKATISKDTPVIDVRFAKPVLRQALPVQSSVELRSK